MKYNLIADAGSTKTDWALTDARGLELCRHTTEGLNALLSTDGQIAGVLEKLSSELPTDAEIGHICFYGAGCATENICSRMSNLLTEALHCEHAEAHSDLLGAARSLLGDSRGIACILGTGSNSCLYDGNVIIRNVPSLGYILGDEGSGSALGKRLVADSFKGHLPRAVADRFLSEYGLSLSDILEKVYRQPSPNRFLASLVPFLKKNLWNPYIYSLIRQEFENFLKRNVSPYDGSRQLPICFTGSIAFHFADILREAARATGFKIGTISNSPLDGLVNYHANHYKS